MITVTSAKPESSFSVCVGERKSSVKMKFKNTHSTHKEEVKIHRREAEDGQFVHKSSVK